MVGDTGVTAGCGTAGRKIAASGGRVGSFDGQEDNFAGKFIRARPDEGRSLTISPATTCPAFPECLEKSGRGCARYHRAFS